MGCSRHDHVHGCWAVLPFLFSLAKEALSTRYLTSGTSFILSAAHLSLVLGRCHRLLSPSDTADTICTTSHHPVCVQKQNSPIASGLHSIYVIQCVPHKHHPPGSIFKARFNSATSVCVIQHQTILFRNVQQTAHTHNSSSAAAAF